MNKIVVAGAGLAMAAGVIAGPIAAASAHPAAPAKTISHGLKLKKAVNVNKVKKGTKIKLTITGAGNKQGYYCLEAAGVPGSKTKIAAYVGTLQSGLLSNAAGVLQCNVTYVHFTAKSQNKKFTASCPPTKAEAKHGVKCMVVVADSASQGKKHSLDETFTTKN